MNIKLLGAAVAAALLALSTASIGQTGATSSGGSSQDTPKEAAAAKAAPEGDTSGAATGSTSGSATTGSSASKNCDTLSGSAKTRCLREHGASSGSSAPAAGAVTKTPGDK